MMKFFRFVLGWCVILVLLLGTVRLNVFQTSFYESFYKKEGLAEQIGVSEEDLNKSMRVMLDYVQGKRKDMEDTIFRNGKETGIYNGKEKAHMGDVRALYRNAMRVLAGSFIVGIVIVVWMAVMLKDKNRLLANVCSGLLSASLCFAIVLAWLGLWIATDFNDFWIRFHHLFFSNDLWLLDPATDFMIVICPENMFSALVTRIVLLFVVVLGMLDGLAYFLLKRKLPIGSEK